MRVLSIDQSLTCSGYCFFEDGKLLDHGVYTTAPDKTDPLDDYKRVKNIVSFFSEYMKKSDMLVLEGLSFSSKGMATRTLGGLQFAIVNYALSLGLDIRVIAPTSMKKFGAGNGKAKKIDLYDSLPPEVKDVLSQYKKTKGRYDVTDSYWLGRYVIEEDK